MQQTTTAYPAQPSGRRLEGQVAVITGGAQGIGWAIALAFVAEGAAVVIADRRGDLAEEAANVLGAMGATALAIAVDITDPAQVANLIGRTVARFKRIDIAVNNAGICPVTRFPQVALDDWRRVFAVNVEGALLVTQEAARAMLLQEPHPRSACRGKVINVSSPAAEVGRPMLAAYGASKAALNHLSKTCADVLGPHAIATTVLYPGSVHGPLWDALLPDLAAAEGRSAEAILAERAARMPNGRFQEPEETARMALYIATAPGMTLHGKLLWSEAHVAPL
jgi:NAD(P)-dependent dehydrogenase (short-subunit alcohol dehydrogenase family)